jgi:thioredoxin reductase (NADPH)
MDYDVIIVGAGPIGLACGIECRKKNLSHLIIEKGTVVNSIFNYPTNMNFFSTSERLEIGDVPFISHGVKPNRTEALEYYRRVKQSWKLNVNTYEKVNSLKREEGNFIVESSKGIYSAKKVIIAIGFYDKVNRLNIKGEELPKVKHYYDEPHAYVDQKVLVIGGGNSAVDVALETYRYGASEVTMVIRKDRLEDNVKYWVKPDIENRIRENSIKAYFNSELIEINDKYVLIKTPSALLKLENDFVLAMTGYHPDFDFLSKIGIQLKDDFSKEPIYDEVTFETNTKGIYLAGVVCCGLDTGKWFIENSRYHAVNIIEDIVNKI